MFVSQFTIPYLLHILKHNYKKLNNKNMSEVLFRLVIQYTSNLLLMGRISYLGVVCLVI